MHPAASGRFWLCSQGLLSPPPTLNLGDTEGCSASSLSWFVVSCLPGFACCIEVDLCWHKWFILFCDPFISVRLVLVSPLLLLILTSHTFLLLWLQRSPFVHLPKHPSFGFIHFLSWLFCSRRYCFILALESRSFLLLVLGLLTSSLSCASGGKLHFLSEVCLLFQRRHLQL